MAQQLYALLQRRALTDRELAAAIVPVVTFFARKRKPKAPGAPTKRQKKATTNICGAVFFSVFTACRSRRAVHGK